MDELKPCPFCGRQVEIVEEGDYLEIVCEECGITMSGGNHERIMADWNRRTEPPKSEVRATPVSGDSPIAVRCQACGCPVVLHRLFEDGVLAGEHIDCACGYVYGWGMED